jgi:hypothetical protein
VTIRRSVLAAALSLAACGGTRTPAADSSAAAVPPAAVQPSPMIPPDTMKADTVKQATADSTAKAAAAKAKAAKAATPPGGFDRLRKPKYTINEKTGKVDTIKRP